MSRSLPFPDSIVRPLDLQRTAASIAANYGDDGAIVITSGKDGIRIGVHNLADSDLQDALCVAIHHAVKKTLV
jgi:hypothetical protein